MSYVIYDLETSITAALKRKATPFYNRNIIVAVGHKRQGDECNTGRYYGSVGAQDGWMEPLLAGTTFLVGHNLKFDVLHGICQGPRNRAAWIKYIDRGGQIWCTQLAEYLLHGMAQEHQILSLDEVAPRYGGNLKNDAVKSLWEAGVDTPDIDKDMLMEYLLGYASWHKEAHPAGEQDEGDIGNTEKVFVGQVEALRARKGIKSALLNMGAMVFTIEAEFNGMFVDLPWAMEHAELLKAQLLEATAELNGFVPKDLPFQFKWTSRFHKSALIFGGDVKYETRMPILDAQRKQVYSQMDQVHVLLSDEQTMPLDEYTTLQMEDPDSCPGAVRYAGGKNKGEVKTKKLKVPDPSKPKSRMETFTYRFPGYTQPDKKWEGADKGVYSCAAEVIEELSLRKGIPFLEALARRADIHKDLSTYFIITDEETGESKGMLKRRAQLLHLNRDARHFALVVHVRAVRGLQGVKHDVGVLAVLAVLQFRHESSAVAEQAGHVLGIAALAHLLEQVEELAPLVLTDGHLQQFDGTRHRAALGLQRRVVLTADFKLQNDAGGSLLRALVFRGVDAGFDIGAEAQVRITLGQLVYAFLLRALVRALLGNLFDHAINIELLSHRWFSC